MEGGVPICGGFTGGEGPDEGDGPAWREGD